MGKHEDEREDRAHSSTLKSPVSSHPARWRRETERPARGRDCGAFVCGPTSRDSQSDVLFPSNLNALLHVDTQEQQGAADEEDN